MGLLFAGTPLLLKSAYREGIKERLGLVPFNNQNQKTKRLWFHGASLGELNALISISREIQRLIPGVEIFVSITTPHGKKRAMDVLRDAQGVFHPPLDIPFAVRSALRRICPHAIIFIETEIWPVWVKEAKELDARVFLLNGRISSRSIGRYMKVKPLIRDVLARMDAMSMISRDDAERIISLGADPEKVLINGNAKYDIYISQVDHSVERRIRELLSIGPSTPVLIAGSTRKGEEEILLDSFKRIKEEFPDSILIIAPRHINRISEIKRIIRGKGFSSFQLFSDIKARRAKRSASIVLIDTFGDLFSIYSISWVVFCGASFVPLGGQNPIEPAVWGKPVLYGPSMDDFVDIKGQLEDAGISFPVSDPHMLSSKVKEIFKDQIFREKVRERAESFFSKYITAGRRHAMVVAKHLERFLPHSQ